jgi:hypothetical protein
MICEDIVIEKVQKQIDADNERLLCSIVCETSFDGTFYIELRQSKFSQTGIIYFFNMGVSRKENSFMRNLLISCKKNENLEDAFKRFDCQPYIKRTEMDDSDFNRIMTLLKENPLPNVKTDSGNLDGFWVYFNNYVDCTAKYSYHCRPLKEYAHLVTIMSIIGYYIIEHYVFARRYMEYFYECRWFHLNDNDEIVSYNDATKSALRYFDKDGNVVYESVDVIKKEIPPIIAPHKSVMNFTDEEVAETAVFQKRFYEELKEKSPYARRLHDWRKMEDTVIEIVEIKDEGKTFDDVANDRKTEIETSKTANGGICYGDFTNLDTGYVINVGTKNMFNTWGIMLLQKNENDISATTNLVYQLSQILENAILLDTRTAYNKVHQFSDVTLEHIFYAPFMFRGEIYIAECSVEEFFYSSDGDRKQGGYCLNSVTTKLVKHTKTNESISVQSVVPPNDFTVAHLFALVQASKYNFYTDLKSPGRQERLNEIARKASSS